MLFAALRDMQWRRRRLVIAIISTGLVFAMTLVMIGLANGFRVEAQRAVDSMGVDTFVIKAGAAGPLLGATPFAEAEVAQVAATPGVTAAAPLACAATTVVEGTLAAKRHRVRGAGARTGHAAGVAGAPTVDARRGRGVEHAGPGGRRRPGGRCAHAADRRDRAQLHSTGQTPDVFLTTAGLQRLSYNGQPTVT